MFPVVLTGVQSIETKIKVVNIFVKLHQQCVYTQYSYSEVVYCDDRPTCVEHHQVVYWNPIEKATIYIDVVSHGDRAVVESPQRHTTYGELLPCQ